MRTSPFPGKNCCMQLETCIDNHRVCNAKNGSILVKKKKGKFVKIENADDLFQLGVNDMDYGEFYSIY